MSTLTTNAGSLIIPINAQQYTIPPAHPEKHERLVDRERGRFLQENGPIGQWHRCVLAFYPEDQFTSDALGAAKTSMTTNGVSAAHIVAAAQTVVAWQKDGLAKAQALWSSAAPGA